MRHVSWTTYSVLSWSELVNSLDPIQISTGVKLAYIAARRHVWSFEVPMAQAGMVSNTVSNSNSHSMASPFTTKLIVIEKRSGSLAVD